ncbi:AIM24 family protein [Geobacillus stearothermophilus]|nr:AIM24 family protein [Geobacillus stearothermophilus]
MNAHEIDYRLYGDDMQFVEIELDPRESVIAEAGAMMMMEDDIAMETVFGDGSSAGKGLLGRLVGAGKRLLTGESLFMTVFTNQGSGKRRVAFAAPYPGKIIPVDLSELGGKLICQKDSFLCAAKGVSVGIEFQRKLGAGFFGGEGLFLATVTGPGAVWVQSLPFSRLADRVLAAAPSAGGRSVGEGSILGGIGDWLDGDD